MSLAELGPDARSVSNRARLASTGEYTAMAPVVACDLGCEQLELMSDHSAGGQPQRQPGADERIAS